MQSDLMQADFRAAAWGHKMNGCGVVTSVGSFCLINFGNVTNLLSIQSIHADISYTLGEYLYKKLKPKSKEIHMDLTRLEVLKGLVANSKTDVPQLIQVSVSTTNIQSNTAQLEWYNVHANGSAKELFATATLLYGDAAEWLDSWIPMTHLVQGRIQELEHLAELGDANRFNHNMAYLLFGNALVDYATKYRGMHSVVLHDLEAFADVVLSTEKGGTWTVPPYFIDSVAHLAGFVMNVSETQNTKDNFCVTPGWKSMRFAKPLVAGAKYRSYVKMIPTAEDPSIFLGDVYILQQDVIVGMVGGIQFRRYPRILLGRFFSAPDDSKAPPVATAASSKSVAVAPKLVAAHATSIPTPTPATPSAPARILAPVPPPAIAAPHAPAPEPTVNGVLEKPDSTTSKAIQIISDEAAIDLVDLTDDASVAALGVDSLMSLVIAEKFRDQLGVTVPGSLFLEFPTIGDLRVWLEEYYD